MNSKLLIYIGMILMFSLSVFSITSESNELLNVVEDYYSAFTLKDVDAYINTQFIYHLDDSELEAKINNIQNIFDSIDVLSYQIGNFEVASVDGEVAIVTFSVKSKLGQVGERGPEVIDYEQSMTAILTTWDSEWKIFQVTTTEMYDFSMNLADVSDVFPEDLLYKEEVYETPSLLSRVGSFFKGMPKLISRSFVPTKPKTCGNYVCDKGEDLENCAEDCKMIIFNPECGNDVCSENETYETCPYDCKPILECGDGFCDASEKNICEEDCPAECGDGVCEYSEKESCREDCVECGDGVCEFDEDEENCEEDCFVESFCGDDVCDADETCSCSDCSCDDGFICLKDRCEESCDSDSDCPGSGICVNGRCLVFSCSRDSDCDDNNDCTDDICTDDGCFSSKITKCRDDDGCCPSSCEERDDNDCIDEDTSDDNSDDDDYTISGTDSIRNDQEDHEFFDFDNGVVTADFDEGDVFINSFGEMMAECSNSVCAGIKEESGSYEGMSVPPESGYDGYVEVEEGKNYWIKTIQGKYAKMEVTSLTDTTLTFNWEYLGNLYTTE